ncbi:MAG: 4'-phosphopantetheinyl transferase superfamily protein [Prolixibacteraceae bacterium]
MPLIRSINIENGLLLVWEMTETAETFAAGYPEAQNDPVFSRITSLKRKQEWVAIRTLLHAANCKPDQLSYTETGQPLINHPEYRSISISHSDRLAGLLLHRLHRAGLDIESANRNFTRVEHKYLSPEEILLALSVPNGHGLFWCIKEAVYKAAGLAGIHFSEQIRISLNEENKPTAHLLTESEQRYELVHFEIAEQIIVYAVPH